MQHGQNSAVLRIQQTGCSSQVLFDVLGMSENQLFGFQLFLLIFFQLRFLQFAQLEGLIVGIGSGIGSLLAKSIQPFLRLFVCSVGGGISLKFRAVLCHCVHYMQSEGSVCQQEVFMLRMDVYQSGGQFL